MNGRTGHLACLRMEVDTPPPSLSLSFDLSVVVVSCMINARFVRFKTSGKTQERVITESAVNEVINTLKGSLSLSR